MISYCSECSTDTCADLCVQFVEWELFQRLAEGTEYTTYHRPTVKQTVKRTGGQTYPYASTHTHTHTTHWHTHKHIHACTHTHKHINIHTGTHTQTNTLSHTQTHWHTQKHTDTHTYMHEQTHTHIARLQYVMYLYPVLWKFSLHGEHLSGVDIRVVGLVESFLQLIQLIRSKYSSDKRRNKQTHVFWWETFSSWILPASVKSIKSWSPS